jgi:hypothetical protein
MSSNGGYKKVEVASEMSPLADSPGHGEAPGGGCCASWQARASTSLLPCLPCTFARRACGGTNSNTGLHPCPPSVHACMFARRHACGGTLALEPGVRRMSRARPTAQGRAALAAAAALLVGVALGWSLAPEPPGGGGQGRCGVLEGPASIIRPWESLPASLASCGGDRGVGLPFAGRSAVLGSRGMAATSQVPTVSSFDCVHGAPITKPCVCVLRVYVCVVCVWCVVCGVWGGVYMGWAGSRWSRWWRWTS